MRPRIRWQPWACRWLARLSGSPALWWELQDDRKSSISQGSHDLWQATYMLSTEEMVCLCWWHRRGGSTLAFWSLETSRNKILGTPISFFQINIVLLEVQNLQHPFSTTFIVLLTGLLYCPGWPGSQYVNQTSLGLPQIHLFLCPKCWDKSHTLPCPT